MTPDPACAEFEYAKPRAYQGKHLWEIDEFAGENPGLIVATVELQDVGATVGMPAWHARAVTGDIRTYNIRRTERPWSRRIASWLAELTDRKRA